MYYPPPEKKQYSDSFIIKQILSWMPFGVPGFILFPQARLILFGTLLMGIYAAVFRYKLRDFFKKLTIETYNTLIDAVFDYKLKKEYYEDAALWVRATYDPVDFTPIKRVFAFILIAVPMGIAAFSLHFIAWIPELTIENAFQIVFPTEFNIENYSLLLPIESISEPIFLFLTYFGVISTLIFYAWVIYWTIHLYILFFMNNSILHHFTFWDQIDDFSKLPKGNVVGHFFTLNLFFWNLSNVILLNPILGIVTALSGWVYSQTNPRYNYFTGMKKPYKHLFLSQYPLLLIGWAVGTVQNYRVFGDWLFPTTMLIVVILFLIILTRLFVMEVDAFDLEKIKPIWRKVGDKLNIKSRKLIVLINLSPVLLFVVVQYIYNPIRVMIFPELDTSLGLNADRLLGIRCRVSFDGFASSTISLELLKWNRVCAVVLWDSFQK